MPKLTKLEGPLGYMSYNFVIVICIFVHGVNVAQSLNKALSFELVVGHPLSQERSSSSSSIITQAVFGVAVIRSLSLAPYGCNVAVLQKSVC